MIGAILCCFGFLIILTYIGDPNPTMGLFFTFIVFLLPGFGIITGVYIYQKYEKKIGKSKGKLFVAGLLAIYISIIFGWAIGFLYAVILFIMGIVILLMTLFKRNLK
jgi:hypothetical protein